MKHHSGWKSRRKQSMAEFRKAAAERWRSLYGTDEYGPCECGCGVWVHRLTPPHHMDDVAGGLGGRRKHDPDRMRFLAERCHMEVERHLREIA